MSEALPPDEPDEALQVAGALRKLAAETRPPRPLPAAGQLWWRAEVVRRLVEKQEVAERELRPAIWSELAGVVLAVAVLLLFFGLQASSFLSALGQRKAFGGILPTALMVLLPLAAASLAGLLLGRRT
jgi:hypothetical protein